MKLFPTEEEYDDVARHHPVPELALVDRRIEERFSADDALFLGNVTLQEWFIHLANRMIDTRQAYHLMMYFFELGIPDDRPFISPGHGGVSVEYLPDFADEDYSKKAWFDFYADAFAHKLFSAWDSMGQLLAVVHGLKIKRPSFYGVASALKERNMKPGGELLDLWNRHEFKRFQDVRHDATHNFLPDTFGGSVTVDSTQKEVLSDGHKVTTRRTMSFGVGRYVSSKKMLTVCDEALPVFDDTLRVVGLRG